MRSCEFCEEMDSELHAEHTRRKVAEARAARAEAERTATLQATEAQLVAADMLAHAVQVADKFCGQRGSREALDAALDAYYQTRAVKP